MKQRVKLTKGGYTSISIDWDKLVLQPMKAGYYLEAFASADAIIDHSIEVILKLIYIGAESRDLIQQLHSLKGQINFMGIAMLAIIKKKKVIDQKFYDKVTKFKKTRNLVLHTIEGEYKLIEDKISSVKNQEELDKIAESEAQKYIGNGFEILEELRKLTDELAVKGYTQEES